MYSENQTSKQAGTIFSNKCSHVIHAYLFSSTPKMADEVSVPVGAISLHRADVLGIFQATLPTTGSCSVHTSKRLTKYTQHAPDAPITLHFADGTTATADILIGADGVRSPTRVTMAQLYNAPEPATWADPVFGGSLLYRCLISIELLEKLNASHRAIHQRIIVRLCSNLMLYFTESRVVLRKR